MTRKHVLVATLIFAATAAIAMAQGSPPKPAIPAPHADPGIVVTPAPGALLTPKSDPGIAVPPPQDGKGTVIQPPGTPGNNPALIPK